MISRLTERNRRRECSRPHCGGAVEPFRRSSPWASGCPDALFRDTAPSWPVARGGRTFPPSRIHRNQASRGGVGASTGGVGGGKSQKRRRVGVSCEVASTRASRGTGNDVAGLKGTRSLNGASRALPAQPPCAFEPSSPDRPRRPLRPSPKPRHRSPRSPRRCSSILGRRSTCAGVSMAKSCWR